MQLIDFKLEKYNCGAKKCTWLHIVVIHNMQYWNVIPPEIWHISLN